MLKKYKISDLIKPITGSVEVLGSKMVIVSSPASINTATHDSFTFCSKKNAQAVELVRNSPAKVIVCSSELSFSSIDYGDKTLILVENPRLAFIEILQCYFTERRESGISPSAVIDVSAEIHPKVYIGPHCYIGVCKIEEGTIIHGNVHIDSNVTIGRNVTINSGVTIGVEDAFAYERNSQGELVKFPHFGGVVIEDDVDIHVHANIDRGTFGNTVIGKGTKINRYAHIGHNGVIGRHCQIGGKVFIAGSCHSGDYCEIAFCCCLRNGTKIGKNVLIGMGSVVTGDVEDDWVVYGAPARKIRKNKILPWRQKSLVEN